MDHQKLKSILKLKKRKKKKKVKWIWDLVTEPTEEEVHIITANVFAMGIKSIFRNHTYWFDNKIILQGDSGPIGLEATGAVAALVMIFFDRVPKKVGNTRYHHLSLSSIY